MKIVYRGCLYEGLNDSFDMSHVLSDEHGPRIAYHYTSYANAKNIIKNGFNMELTYQHIIWFTFEKNKIPEVSKPEIPIKLYVSMKKPANWNEYNNLTLNELESRGYDGALLGNDGFVFDPKQLYIIK